jgi:hypothetical protein
MMMHGLANFKYNKFLLILCGASDGGFLEDRNFRGLMDGF